MPTSNANIGQKGGANRVPREGFSLNTISDLTKWDWLNQHVASNTQFDILASPYTSLILATLPRFTSAPGSLVNDQVVPIGLTQGFNVGESNEVVPLPEIGSLRSRFAIGRTAGQISLSRVLFDGPSLLRVLTAVSNQKLGGIDSSGSVIPQLTGPKPFDQDSHNPSQEGASGDLGSDFGDSYVNDAPGFQQGLSFYASKVPFGLIVTYLGQGDHYIGSMMYENCQIQNYATAITPGTPLVGENVTVLFDRAIPVAVNVRENSSGTS